MAADPMSMSLDALIEKNKTKSPNRSKGQFGGRGRGRGRGKTFRPRKVGHIGKNQQQSPSKGRLSQNKRIKTPFNVNQRGFRSRSSLNKQKQQIESKQRKSLTKLYTGALVEIDPLNPDILESDIKELCTQIGEIRSIKMSNSRRVETRSKGAIFKRAEVRFRKRTDAETAVKKLNRRALDDTLMNVSIKK